MKILACNVSWERNCMYLASSLLNVNTILPNKELAGFNRITTGNQRYIDKAGCIDDDNGYIHMVKAAAGIDKKKTHGQKFAWTGEMPYQNNF